MRWDLIDQFEILQKRPADDTVLSYVRATKSYKGTEDFFKEHTPAKPFVPETLLIEMIAQAGGVLFGLGFDFKKEVILAKIAEAQFFEPVSPPCTFLVEATLDNEREEGAWVSGTVKKKGTPVAKVTLLLATVDGIDLGSKKQIVFNEDFLKHYDIYNVVKKSEAMS